MNEVLNYVQVGAGAAAICCCCGRRSRPVAPNDQGEPDLWNMARGWSEAPYPADCKHADGSTGSTYHCPSCNRKLHNGESLQRRAYLGAQGSGFVRRLAA